MRFNRRAHVGACAVAVLLFASPVLADTVEITSGSANYYWDGSMTSFSLAAPDSNFVSEYFGQARSGFNGGESVDLSTTIPFTNAGNHPLSETLHNQQYQVWLSGSLTITAQPFVAPPANGDASTFQSFTTSFKMSGTVSGFATRDHTGTPLFTATLFGGGTISAGPYRIVGNQYALTGSGGESFTFAPTSWLPGGWLSSDIGVVGLTGYAYQGSDGDLFMGGAGSDIWGTADSFRFVYQTLDSDGEILAVVGAESDLNAFAKAGVMIRQTVDPASPHVMLDVKPDGGLEFMTRASAGGQTRFLAGGTVPTTQSAPPGPSVTIYAYLRLTRRGTTITASVCRNDTCEVLGNTPWISGPALIGVAVTSHDPARMNDAYFPASMPTITRNTLPAPWVLTDVGAVGTSGRASQSNGVFTVEGAGSDIWGSADSFASVAQPMTGDGQISARVVAEQNTNVYAKAGLSLGGTAASNARVVLDVKPDGGIEFMARLADGASMSFLSGGAAAFPVYLRLTQTGDRVDAASSSDGNAWSPVGSVQITLPSTANIGLAVTSHDATVLNSSTFDHVTVQAAAATTSGGNLIVNGGFEQSSVPPVGPGWVADSGRQTPAVAETTDPFSGAINGACLTTDAKDCGLYQDVVVPSAGAYTLTTYTDASRAGALVGWNVNGVSLESASIVVGGYVRHTFAHQFAGGETIRVWLYSPATAGWAVIDEVSIVRAP